MFMLGLAKKGLKVVFSRVKHKITQGYFLRPVLRKFFSPKKLVLGDTNNRFTCWGWETVDLVDSDYLLDLRTEVLPLSDNSANLVFSSHMIEHISDASASRLFLEIYRILRPGGTLRLVTPDLDKILQAYADDNLYFFLRGGYANSLCQRISRGQLPEESLEIHNRLIAMFASYSGRCDTTGGPIVDRIIVDQKLRKLDKYAFAKWCASLLEPNRIYAHINAYDYEKVKDMLLNAGFDSVGRSSFRNSAIEELRKSCFDLENHSWMSLYVEAIKE